MVAPDQSDEVWISHLIGQEKQEGFNTIEASIDEISQKEVADFGDVSAIFEEFQEVIELSMDVPTDGDRGVNSLHVALFDQDLSGLGAEVLDFLLADYLSLPEQFYLLVQLAHRCLSYILSSL